MPSDDYSSLYVLIVDDFHNFREAVSKNMYSFGFRHIDSVASGEEAVELCSGQHYDIILSDYNLGDGKNGQQLLEELRLKELIRADDIFMLISADTSRDVVMSTYDCGLDVYLTKPITGKVLEQRIKRLIAKRSELAEIYWCIGKKDIKTAIGLLKNHLKYHKRYIPDCQKLLGELYLKEKEFDLAEQLYKGVLQTRELDWAQVGLANVELERGSANSACYALEEVIAANPAYLNAYDSLSKACVKMGDTEKLQKTLEKAAEVSPMSTSRQKHLAEVALSNGDLDVAMNAYKKTIKYGANSCHESPENYLNFAKTITKVYDNDIDKGKEASQDALTLLTELNEKYELSDEQKLQAKLLGSQIYALGGNKPKSKDLLFEAKGLLVNSDASSIDVEIEMVKALIASEKYLDAQQMLDDLVERYANDQSALEKLDLLLNEPVSEKGKAIIGKINKEGISAYKNKDYNDSVKFFTKAQKKFPRYIGLKLNFIQAMIGSMKAYGNNPTYIEQCESTFKVIGKNISPKSPQFKRYQQLQAMFQQVSHEPDQESEV